MQNYSRYDALMQNDSKGSKVRPNPRHVLPLAEVLSHLGSPFSGGGRSVRIEALEAAIRLGVRGGRGGSTKTNQPL